MRQLIGTFSSQLSKTLRYSIGDIGPGGGKIFYVNSAGFTAGPTMNLTHYYLEAAPTTGTNAWTDINYNWSGTTSVSVPSFGANGTDIGRGYTNTLAIVAQDSTATKASTLCRAYLGPNSLTDWFLPCKDELTQLYIRQSIVGGIHYSSVNYWSSSQVNSTNAWSQDFQSAYPASAPYSLAKNSQLWIRPIRSF